MVAMRATTGRSSVKTTGRALRLRKVKVGMGMVRLANRAGHPCCFPRKAGDVNSLIGILSIGVCDATRCYSRVSMDEIASTARPTKRSSTLSLGSSSKDACLSAVLEAQYRLAFDAIGNLATASRARWKP